MGKTWTLRTIKDATDPDKDVVIVDKEFVAVKNIETNKLTMLFKKAGHRYVCIDLPKTIGFIAEKLAPHVDVKKFLTELITVTSPPQEIMELKDRLEGVPKISEAPRCLALMIGGKRGRPYEFIIVGEE